MTWLVDPARELHQPGHHRVPGLYVRLDVRGQRVLQGVDDLLNLPDCLLRDAVRLRVAHRARLWDSIRLSVARNCPSPRSDAGLLICL